jgi:cytoskeletal protein CcmA (bactofilin family)
MIENGNNHLIKGKRLFVKTGAEFTGDRTLKGSQAVLNEQKVLGYNYLRYQVLNQGRDGRF